MSAQKVLVFLILGSVFQCPSLAAPNDVSSQLEQARKKYGLPALAAAVFNHKGIVALGATGVRKLGEPIPVTIDDPWHLGSETKAMTATLAGTFVAQGKLAWDDKVITYFPEWAGTIDPQLRDITIGQLLTHQAGLRANLPWVAFDQALPLTQQRKEAAHELMTTPPEFAPGTYHYSNAGYVLIGAVLEQIGQQPWEKLMEAWIFQPLHMTAVGFGGTGTPGRIDAPWGHREDGLPVRKNGPMQDNPPVMAPAGRVHASVTSWAEFLVDQLRGAAGESALLPASIYTAIQTPQFGGSYAFGWSTATPPWAKGGKVITHAGSNTMNYAVCWLALDQGFGVLLCTNEAGKQASAACRQAGLALIQEYTSGNPPDPEPHHSPQ
jgi:CubicO group peptidase (beta-lactamase class C family)